MRKAVRPIALLVVVTAGAFGLAKAHPFKPGAPKASAGSVRLGDQYRGETVFQKSCASCHGDAGVGGGIGPPLAGSGLAPAQVKAQVDAGGGAMPPALVSGGDEEDVIAYVASIAGK
jgi:mono/diheme cytochrome c family protein